MRRRVLGAPEQLALALDLDLAGERALEARGERVEERGGVARVRPQRRGQQIEIRRVGHGATVPVGLVGQLRCGAMADRTGWVWHERYAWHDARGLMDSAPPEALFEPEPSLESGVTKRRFRNLVDASGLLARLVADRPAPGGRRRARVDPRPGVHRRRPRAERRRRRRRGPLDAVRPRHLRGRRARGRRLHRRRRRRGRRPRRATPTRSSARPATTRGRTAAPATASSRTSRWPRCTCSASAASGGSRSSTGTSTTATARRRRSGRTRACSRSRCTRTACSRSARGAGRRPGRGRARGRRSTSRCRRGRGAPRTSTRSTASCARRSTASRPSFVLVASGLDASMCDPLGPDEPHERVLRRADRPRPRRRGRPVRRARSCSATRAATRAPTCRTAAWRSSSGSRASRPASPTRGSTTTAPSPRCPLRADESAAVDAAARDSLARMAEILVTLNDSGEAYVGLAGPERR